MGRSMKIKLTGVGREHAGGVTYFCGDSPIDVLRQVYRDYAISTYFPESCMGGVISPLGDSYEGGLEIFSAEDGIARLRSKMKMRKEYEAYGSLLGTPGAEELARRAQALSVCDLINRDLLGDFRRDSPLAQSKALSSVMHQAMDLARTKCWERRNALFWEAYYNSWIKVKGLTGEEACRRLVSSEYFGGFKEIASAVLGRHPRNVSSKTIKNKFVGWDDYLEERLEKAGASMEEERAAIERINKRHGGRPGGGK